MPGSTSPSLSTNTDEHAAQCPSLQLPASYTCTACQISFSSLQEQRLHMTEPWHVYNIKRRIASLPSISHDTFDKAVDKRIDINEVFTGSSGNDEEISDNEDEQSASAFQCLFCSQGFASNDAGLAANLEHMLSIHEMSVPDPEGLVVDMQSLIEYLATSIRTWHECLYCGATKPSTRRIQSHMRDKGHCRLNLDREPELLEFWENPQLVKDDSVSTNNMALEQNHPVSLSATELRFPSGKIITSRHAAPTPRKASQNPHSPASTTRSLPPESEQAALPTSSSSSPQTLIRSQPPPPSPQPQPQPQHQQQQLTRHASTSLTGLSSQQNQALIVAAKTAQRHEAIARRSREWGSAKGANAQEFDQLNGRHKWGKQQHKLLPR